MRSIPIYFLCIGLTLLAYGCFSSHKRGDEDASGFDRTDVTAETGGIEDIIGMGGKGVIEIDDDAGMNDAPCAPNCPDLDWVTIPGGAFMMGSAEGEGDSNEHPQHEVTVQTFKISKTEVTVTQYGICVDAGICSEPISNSFDDFYNWGKSGRENHPINRVNWFQASEYAEWLGARLPSETEWEYAARSGGRDILYPWGNEEASCENAVISRDKRGNVCEHEVTAEVCSNPLGNTAQGLCDMAGNVSEWVEDDWHDNYIDAPPDGQAWIDSPRDIWRVLRGGSSIDDPGYCRSASRDYYGPGARYGINYGFRVVLDLN